MPSLILDLNVDRVDLVGEGANSASFIRLYKGKETEQTMELEQILEKMKPEHSAVIQEAIAKAKEASTEEVAKAKKETEDAKAEAVKKQEELDSLNEEVKKSKTSGEPTHEDIIKGLDPAVQEIFKSMRSQKEAAEQVARDAAEQAATDEAIAKAKDLKALPVEEAELVNVLKGLSPEVMAILKAANTAIEEGGIFSEVGKSKADSTSTSSGEAWDKIEKAAEKISDEQKVSKERATMLAVQDNPDLYREYLKGGKH